MKKKIVFIMVCLLNFFLTFIFAQENHDQRLKRTTDIYRSLKFIPAEQLPAPVYENPNGKELFFLTDPSIIRVMKTKESNGDSFSLIRKDGKSGWVNSSKLTKMQPENFPKEHDDYFFLLLELAANDGAIVRHRIKKSNMNKIIIFVDETVWNRFNSETKNYFLEMCDKLWCSGRENRTVEFKGHSTMRVIHRI